MPVSLMLTLLLAVAPPAVQLSFPASAGRLNTGIYFRQGEQIEVRASGSWSMWSGHYGLSNANGHRQFDGRYCWGRLMASIGGGDPESVGTGRRWVTNESGLLILFPHTDKLGLPAPDGALDITIRGGHPVQEVIAELAAKGHEFEVPAASDGFDTGIFVKDDDLVTIDAFGEWRMYPGGPFLDPDGDRQRFLANGMRWGYLLARFGGPTFAAGPSFTVGSTGEVRPARGGLLWLSAATGEFSGYERSGSLRVVVRGANPATREQQQESLRRVSDEQRSYGFLRIYQLRAALYLPSAFCSPELMRAAQAHAEYLAAQDAGDHDELAGAPGFTGKTPDERAASAGFKGQLAGELVHGYTDGVTAVDGLWGTIYHRTPLVDPAATAYGTGVAQGKRRIYVVLAGVPQTQPTDTVKVPAFATYPADGQVNVPTAWNGLEMPSPWDAALTAPVGYPISVTLTSDDITKVLEAGLFDQDGRPVEAQVFSPASDPRKLLRASVFLVPKRALLPNQQYRCRVKLATDHKPIETEWQFTTSDATAPLLAMPQLDRPSNPPVVLGR